MGAGVAGLAAARQLQAAGERVCLLEARDRLLAQVMAQPSQPRDSLHRVLARVYRQPPTPELNFYLNTTLEHERAADIAELSHQYLDSDDAFAGKDVLFPQGYSGIITYLSQVPTPLTIYRNQAVQRIHYGAANAVTVETRQQAY